MTRHGRLHPLLSVPDDIPELLIAQYRACTRQMPMMYGILVASSWALAASHNRRPTPQITVHALKQANRLAMFFALGFVGWALALFPYGDAYQRSQVLFYMAITVIASIFCLTHLRSAAVIVTSRQAARRRHLYRRCGNIGAVRTRPRRRVQRGPRLSVRVSRSREADRERIEAIERERQQQNPTPPVSVLQ
jgi:hypothetical protein